jgi:diaminopimelate epimerase
MIPYSKYHALGNDYIVMDPAKCPLEPTPERIRLICHRNFGVGSDGILWGPVMKNGRVSLRIFNPDGGEAEKSGNGVRIFSRYLIDEGWVKTDSFELDTPGGTVLVEKMDGEGRLLRVEMGKLSFSSAVIPVAGTKRDVVDEPMEFGGKTYRATCVTIGNPHCVIPAERAEPGLARSLGPLVENSPRFPNRINMQLLEVLDRNNIKIEIWERGAGYTLASGTSSCAAAGAARRLGMTEQDVTVHMPGGEIRISIDEDWTVHMTGSVNAVGRGEFAPQFEQELRKLP